MEGPEKIIGEIMEVAGEQEARVGVGFGGDADANKTLRVTCDSRPQSIRQWKHWDWWMWALTGNWLVMAGICF